MYLLCSTDPLRRGETKTPAKRFPCSVNIGRLEKFVRLRANTNLSRAMVVVTSARRGEQ